MLAAISDSSRVSSLSYPLETRRTRKPPVYRRVRRNEKIRSRYSILEKLKSRDFIPLAVYLATTGRSIGQASTGTRAARSAQPTVVIVTLSLLGIVTLPLAFVLSSIRYLRVVPRIFRELAGVVVGRVVLSLILSRRGDRANRTRPRVGQHVEILLGELVDQGPVILHQLSSVLGHSDSNHPSFQRRVILRAKEFDVLCRLRLLQSRMFHGETKICRCFVLLLPPDTVVNLVHVEGGQANEVASSTSLFLRPIVQA